MKENAYYFPHDYAAANDTKIIILVHEYGAAGYGIYWSIVELLHAANDNKIEMADYLFRGLSAQMQTPVEEIRKILSFCINNCDLFYVTEDRKLGCKRVERNIQYRQELKNKRSLAGKASAEKRRKGKIK